ncbi:uncharacterized protein LOC143202725 [Rhynchophorus ferrugineus]|uniref:uncharacterized protein LOC143202725 n=1 Tax=Rhynchophorus ferrugineus TaxID=354439 RepID=UPI003FCCAC12
MSEVKEVDAAESRAEDDHTNPTPTDVAEEAKAPEAEPEAESDEADNIEKLLLVDEPKEESPPVKDSDLKIKDVEIVDVKNFVLTPRDSKDPSYGNLVLPYRVVCRQRYRRAGAIQRAQFIKEIKQHELLQTKALDGVRIHREFCNAIIRQPRPESLIKLTERQKLKLEELLAEP